MRTARGVLLITLIVTLSVGCSSASEQPAPTPTSRQPDCPENTFDLGNFLVRHVHDNGDGKFYLIQLRIDIEEVKNLLTELAADIVNPFSEVEAGDLAALVADTHIYTDLDITPCHGR